MSLSILQRLARRRTNRQITSGPAIRQTRFLGCDLLVRAHEDVGRSIILGDFESDDLRHFASLLNDADVVFDIGANVGAYCMPISRLRPGARVYAFEPIPLNAALLRASVLANSASNVEVVESCVSDASGSVIFSVATDSAYSSMVDTRRKPEQMRIACEAVTLDDFCARRALKGPDVVKVDVEGAELKVLEGASALFSARERRPRVVMLELYDQNLRPFGASVPDVVALMQRWNYEAYVLVDNGPTAFRPEHHNVHYNVFFRCAT